MYVTFHGWIIEEIEWIWMTNLLLREKHHYHLEGRSLMQEGDSYTWMVEDAFLKNVLNYFFLERWDNLRMRSKN